MKSFSKAAVALFLTQPTISSHMKSLEDDVGIRLLDRLGRNVLPTKAGEVLYKHALAILNIKKNAAQALNELMGRVKGQLTIGGSTVPGEYILPEYVSRFKKNHSGITIKLKIGDTEDIINMLIDGDIEIGVVGSDPDSKKIECREFLKDELVFVTSQQYFKDLKKGIELKDLKNLPFIIREDGSGTRKTLEEGLRKKGLSIEDFNIVAEIGSSEAVKQAIKKGLGISLLSRYALQDESLLKKIAVKDFIVTRHFYIITDKTRAKSPICQSFMAFL